VRLREQILIQERLAFPDQALPIFIADKLSMAITAVLLAAASISWIGSYYLMPLMMSMGTSGMMAGSGAAAIVSSASLPSVGFFDLVWVIGMAAMMFPAMIPVVLFYNRVKARLDPRVALVRFAGTTLFLAGYLVMYAFLGVSVFLVVYAAISLSSSVMLPSLLLVIAPSAVLVLAGIYQLTPLKDRCLSNCVSPVGFFATHSREGLMGAFRMGFSHGEYCVGCCWAYMLVMLAVGAMSIPVMAALAGLIAVEKVIVRGSVWFNRIVGVGLITLGIILVILPTA